MENQDINLNSKWGDLSFYDKVKFFKGWAIITFFSTIFQISASLISTLKGSVDLEFFDYMNGISSFLAWITLVQYLEYSPKHSFIAKTMSAALPIVIKSIV
jgi:ABC-type antimicrobial peptide transport system permease subunit